MSRIVTGQTMNGGNKITERFGKLGITITATATADATDALALADDLTVKLESKHPTYSRKEYFEEGNLMKRLELNALIQGPIEVETGGGQTVIRGELLVVWPKEEKDGKVRFGGNIEPIQDEEYILTIGGFPADLNVSIDAIEVEGGAATVLVKHSYSKCFSDVYSGVGTRGAKFIGIERAKLVDLKLNYPKTAPGGARQILRDTAAIGFLQNDFQCPVYLIDGVVTNRGKYYYILDVLAVETVDIKYNAEGLVELLSPMV